MTAPRRERQIDAFGTRLGEAERRATIDWIAGRQRADGSIPWFDGGKTDPWDHVQCAMALAGCGRIAESEAAFRYLARVQGADGAWPSAVTDDGVADATRDSNHAAYLATGLWFLHRTRPDVDFLAAMWPALERAIEFALALQDESGAIWWAVDAAGTPWPAPLVAGSSSVHGSLGCAAQIAAMLGHDRPRWREARARLAAALRDEHPVFRSAHVAEAPGRYSMDWYYPILGGAVRGDAARGRLAEGSTTFLDTGFGCRCVRERRWYTVAETCELVIALDACGFADTARELFDWARTLRAADGSYWTGIAYPENLHWPEERPTWTAATVLLAADVLGGTSPTSSFFRDLGAP